MKAPKKLPDGKWLVDVRPSGVKGSRVQRKFATKIEANQFLKLLLSKSHSNKEWTPNKADSRRLSDLVEKWYDLHGYTLKTGNTKKKYILANVRLLGDPIAKNFSSTDFLEFRKNRLTNHLTTVNREVAITPATVNYDLSTLKSVFNTLINLGEWKAENPLEKIKLLKLDENERGFLNLNEIGTLLQYLDDSNSDSVCLVAKICLSTGARWSEAQELRGEQIRSGKITFYKTKNSKMRSIPIGKQLENEIFDGRPHNGKLFDYCYKTFLRCLKKSKLQLPKNQATHVLRHSFASHFIMNGGNLVTLSKILGHTTIQMTMRYAHLAPEYLNDAVQKNALQLYKDKSALE